MRRHSIGHTARLAALVLLAVAVLLPGMVVDSSAQDRVVRRVWSLFDVFTPSRERDPVIRRFPDRPQAPRATNRARKAATPKPRKPKTRVIAAPAAPAEPVPVAVEKVQTAKTIMVIGDFIAGGLAEGLEGSFVKNANVRILDRSQGSSGFVREDVYDWKKEVVALIEAEKPAAIALLMGANDRQPMRVGDNREAPRSEVWTMEYEARAMALADVIKARNVPLVWVSVPPFKSPRTSQDILAFNTIYKTTAAAAGAEFVDIWDGFVDENGNFVMSGPDVNGQPVRLRSGDGTNLTAAGKAKIAFYAEKPLRKLLGQPAEDGMPAPNAVAPVITPDAVTPHAIDRTDPIALNDPNLDGATDLLGGPAAATQPQPPAANAVPDGRADNFGGDSAAIRLPGAAGSVAATPTALPPDPTSTAAR